MFDESRIIVWRPEDGPVFPVTPVPEKAFGSGIVVRGSNWLGDAVMTFPALKQLRTILPSDCALSVATPAGLAPLYRALPEIVDQVIPLKNAHAFPDGEERTMIRRTYAGVGFLFNNSFRDALSLKLCGVRRLYGAKARNRSWLMAASWKFEKRRDRELNHPHQSSKYLSMVYAIGAEKWDGVMPPLQPRTQPRSELAGFLENPHILAVAPGAAYGDGKRWRAEYFRQVAAKWLEMRPGGIVLALGSKSERNGAEEALSGLPPDQVFDLAGETTLDELIRVLQQAEFCIANDSGIMHLSAAAGGRGIAVFGSTDPAATSPLSQNWHLLYDKLPCSPCFKRVCPLGTKACMDRITARNVVEHMAEMCPVK